MLFYYTCYKVMQVFMVTGIYLLVSTILNVIKKPKYTTQSGIQMAFEYWTIQQSDNF